MKAWLLVAAAVCRAASAEEPVVPKMEVLELEPADENGGEGYTAPKEVEHQTLRFTGYLDVGFAAARGNGSSFAPGDYSLPADYGVDPFAPAVNSRGEVAGLDSGGRFTNGFLPRTVGIGNRPSFLINTLSADLRYTPVEAPLFVFARVQLLPRFVGGGDATRVLLQQAFGRFSPFSTEEFAVFLGKFDSVFGIEYLDNEANLRTGITPSLVARYTTGQSVGLKAFYRVQIAPLWSALSLNVAATNSGSRVEELVGPDKSLVGVPVGTARLGYELNLPWVQAKAGLSGLYGPRNDQTSLNVRQMGLGVDFRIQAYGFTLSAELLRIIEEAGVTGGKVTGQGLGELASAFYVTGGYVQGAYRFPFEGEVISHFTLYARYDRRHATFQGFTPVDVDRFTVGGRLDLFDRLALKAEMLFNRELGLTPASDNDVFTTSAVFTF